MAQPLAKGRNAVRPLARPANWIVGLAAALLVLVSVGGYLWHRGQLAAIAAKHLRLFVVGPSTLQTGTDAQFTVATTAIGGQPLPAQIEVALLAADKRLKTYKETADEQGRLQVAIPADLKLPDRVQLQVVAWYGKSKAAAETTLPVVPDRHWTHLVLDRPQYRPGETVRFRLLGLSRFGLKADRPLPVHFEIRAPGGTIVSGLESELVTRAASAPASLSSPASRPAGSMI